MFALLGTILVGTGALVYYLIPKSVTITVLIIPYNRLELRVWLNGELILDQAWTKDPEPDLRPTSLYLTARAPTDENSFIVEVHEQSLGVSGEAGFSILGGAFIDAEIGKGEHGVRFRQSLSAPVRR
ncbi:MAG TPA: hypothetical protein VI893_08865 [Thermoplasmata archaeon]|nr:hypothetical protein [Thermoplasmata archaeon]